MPENSAANVHAACENDAQLELVIANYIRECEGGASPNRRQVLDRYPELADELRQFFAQRDRMNQLAAPLRQFGNSLIHAVGPGQEISYVGNYELLEEIARGGMGVVYKARQKTLGRVVAVKMIVSGRLATDEDVQRFQVEAQAAAGLQHPHIVSIHEVGQHDGWHYFSMDYVEGRSLAAMLRDHALPAQVAARYVLQMAQAIHYAHQQGTLHRDLKPSNVLIDTHDQVRITDFGLAMRVEDNSDLTRTGQIVGTPSYMPPEQAQSKRSLIGPGSDVYALGAVLYECLTGRPPFRAESVMETLHQVIHAEPAAPRLLNPSLPRDLETICLKCLEKETHKRYATAQLLAEDLERFVAGEPIQARPIGRSERLWRSCRKNPSIAAMSVSLAGLLVTIATLATLGYLREFELRAAADKSVSDLQAEQRRSSQLTGDVVDLEQRRIQLLASLAAGEKQLGLGEEKLGETYLQLARSAYRAESIELADFYLNQCPAPYRNSAWHNLKRQCYPDLITLEGRGRVIFSRDGKLLAALAGETVQVWETAAQRLLHTLRGPQSKVLAIAFSPDGHSLAAGFSREVVLWELTDGTVVQTLVGHSGAVTDVDFSADGKLLASASLAAINKGEVILWDVASWKQVRSLPGVRHAVLSHDGRWLASCRAKGEHFQETVVWDLSAAEDENPTPYLVIAGVNSGCRPAFHPLENELAVGQGSDNMVEFWDIAARKAVKRFTGELAVGCLAYSADGKRLACAGVTSGFAFRPGAFRVVTWNLVTREKERTLPWYSSPILSAAFSPDSQRLATADDAAIKVWDITPPPDPTSVILNDISELKVGRYD